MLKHLKRKIFSLSFSILESQEHRIHETASTRKQSKKNIPTHQSTAARLSLNSEKKTYLAVSLFLKGLLALPVAWSICYCKKNTAKQSLVWERNYCGGGAALQLTRAWRVDFKLGPMSISFTNSMSCAKSIFFYNINAYFEKKICFRIQDSGH